MNSGVIFVSSLIFLVLVVCSVYTLAADDNEAGSVLVKRFFRRFGQLAGLLVALAVVVHFLGLL